MPLRGKFIDIDGKRSPMVIKNPVVEVITDGEILKIIYEDGTVERMLVRRVAIPDLWPRKLSEG